TSTSNVDPIVSVRGAMAGEPLHYMKAGAGVWHAIGGGPVDMDSLLANAIVQRASGATETARVRFRLPKAPPPVAQPLAVDSTFTQPLDGGKIARIHSDTD